MLGTQIKPAAARSLGEIIRDPGFKSNNFDFIRLVAAFLVILSHSFTLCAGNNLTEPLYRLTGTTTLGETAVLTFFIISGFLITLSYHNSESTRVFLSKRLLRLYPAIVVVVILTVFVFAPAVTILPARDYFTRPETYRYLWTMTIFDVRFYIPGVFTGNPYPGAVNGSLWSLRYELLCYMVLPAGAALRLLKRRFVAASVLLSAGGMVLLTLSGFAEAGPLYTVRQLLRLYVFFGIGMLFYYYGDLIRIRLSWFLYGCGLLLGAVFTPFFPAVYAVCGAYGLFFFAFARMGKIQRIARYGDFSYGLYIYAFPIQQWICSLLPGTYRQWWLVFLLAAPLALLCAILSWHLVEKRFIHRYKKGRPMPAF